MLLFSNKPARRESHPGQVYPNSLRTTGAKLPENRGLPLFAGNGRLRLTASLIWVMLILLSSCGGGDSSPVVATYRNEKLTQKQLSYFLPDSLSTADSTRFANKYIEQWQKEQAICDVALSKFKDLDEEIEQKVADYRRKLITHYYTSRIISDSLRPEVQEGEIEAYYNSNRDKFIARENLFSYFYLSTNSEKTGDVDKWMRSDQPEDLESLKEWAKINALEYKLDSNFATERVVGELSKGYFGNLKKDPVGKLIRWNTVILGQRRKYFFKKLEMAQAGESEPLSRVREDIRSILLNERRISLVEREEERILRDARANNYFK